jgi:hypothetical protein
MTYHISTLITEKRCQFGQAPQQDLPEQASFQAKSGQSFSGRIHADDDLFLITKFIDV